MTVVFESEALQEYHEAARYAEDRFGCGANFVAAVQLAVQSIEERPECFQPVGQNIRICRLKRFPYYLFFHHSGDVQTITIYAVAHHKRRPGYWRGRVN
jgi:plasmid stabilization system protein ParE